MGSLLLLTLGYLIGSIPFGLVLTRLAGLGDIRNIGSGNIGATNVLRTGNKPLALATLLLDSGKGAIAVFVALLAVYFFNNPQGNDAVLHDQYYIALHASSLMLVGLGAVLGHCFPVWLKFKGGKGVATTLGTLLAAVPVAGLIACGAWLVSALVFRISSLSALIAIAIMPIAVLFFYGMFPAAIGALITALVFIRHKDNIKRIHNGTEPRIGDKKKHEKSVSDQAGS